MEPIMKLSDRSNSISTEAFPKKEIANLKIKVERALLQSKGASVVVQGDTQAKLGLFISVMDQIKLAGVENISIASVKPK